MIPSKTYRVRGSRRSIFVRLQRRIRFCFTFSSKERAIKNPCKFAKSVIVHDRRRISLPPVPSNCSSMCASRMICSPALTPATVCFCIHSRAARMSSVWHLPRFVSRGSMNLQQSNCRPPNEHSFIVSVQLNLKLVSKHPLADSKVSDLCRFGIKRRKRDIYYS